MIKPTKLTSSLPELVVVDFSKSRAAIAKMNHEVSLLEKTRVTLIEVQNGTLNDIRIAV